ncbi:uncharacterized protein KGF55_004682 [Candida pseudojiufengensis]|uniref:uncharacterized protein n=1 Tax=Candida pseudojiufengensis TaxID=497109 RepID=UPI0022244568|nr:uncharacterized protein KGF55_004682 [Candida pseudojiufengensis]KAI5960390.1 hypothetical protein KGF55_004682 [Candida pseudojiufengensis]
MSNTYTTTTTNISKPIKINSYTIQHQQQNEDINLSNCLPILVEISWNKIVGSKERIFLSQLRNLFNEIGKILRIESIFNEEELNLIEIFISSKPTYRLNKQELIKFILKSIHLNSFEKLLKERFQFDDCYVNECIQRAFNGDIVDNTSTISRDYNEYKRNVGSDYTIKEESISNERRDEVDDKNTHLIRSELNQLKSKTEEQELEIRNLKIENEKLLNQINQLPVTSSSRNENKDKLKDIEKNLKIEELTEKCEKCMEENKKLKLNEIKISKSFETLEKKIAKQDQLLENYRRSRSVTVERKSFSRFDVLNRFSFKWNVFKDIRKHSLKDVRIILLLIVSLFTFLALLSVGVQIIKLISNIVTRSCNTGYVYDNYNNGFWKLSLTKLYQTPIYLKNFIYNLLNR